MNFLAHAHLSFHHPEILVGNMISDDVKGKKKFDYAPAILNGIMLHRAIDAFTDMHPVTKRAKHFFRAEYGLYAGAFIDVCYDHFLAIDLHEFPGDSLTTFSNEVYDTLDEYLELFPPRFAAMYPHMKKHNWLLNYRHTWSIDRSFNNLVHRARYLDESVTAFHIFQQRYDELQQCYNEFFPQLRSFTRNIFDGFFSPAAF